MQHCFYYRGQQLLLTCWPLSLFWALLDDKYDTIQSFSIFKISSCRLWRDLHVNSSCISRTNPLNLNHYLLVLISTYTMKTHAASLPLHWQYSFPIFFLTSDLYFLLFPLNPCIVPWLLRRWKTFEACRLWMSSNVAKHPMRSCLSAVLSLPKDMYYLQGCFSSTKNQLHINFTLNAFLVSP